MATTTKVARSLAEKMNHFRALLLESEQKALDELLAAFAAQVIISEKKTGGSQLFKSATSKSVLKEMKELKISAPGGGVAITPTWTTVTITTTIASHPWIGCLKANTSGDTQLVHTVSTINRN